MTPNGKVVLSAFSDARCIHTVFKKDDSAIF